MPSARAALLATAVAPVLALAGVALPAGATATAEPATSAAVPATPAPGIVNGARDGAAHPFVVMVQRPGTPYPTCSGVLVRDDHGSPLVLTDAHCLYAAGHATGTGVLVTDAPQLSSAAPRYAGSYVIDPAYNPAVSAAHDLAAVVFRTPPPDAPATLAPVGYDDHLPSGVAWSVGFGAPDLGQRRIATEVVTGRTASWLYLRPGTGNTCDGDSGGPDLVPHSATVIALTDQGTCSYDEDTRVDTVEAHAFAVAASARLDPTPPSVRAYPPTVSGRSVRSVWGARDDASGVASFDAAVSTDGAPYRLWRTGVVPTFRSGGFAAASGSFTGAAGHSYRVEVRARDRRGNTSGWTATTAVRLPDAVAPTGVLYPVAVDGATLTVTWGGSDAGGSGVAGFDVDVAVGAGRFAPWRTDAAPTWRSATFAAGRGSYRGRPGALYTFVSRVRSAAGTVSAWGHWRSARAG